MGVQKFIRTAEISVITATDVHRRYYSQGYFCDGTRRSSIPEPFSWHRYNKRLLHSDRIRASLCFPEPIFFRKVALTIRYQMKKPFVL
jgi:hypothetical protein